MFVNSTLVESWYNKQSPILSFKQHTNCIKTKFPTKSEKKNVTQKAEKEQQHIF